MKKLFLILAAVVCTLGMYAQNAQTPKTAPAAKEVQVEKECGPYFYRDFQIEDTTEARGWPERIFSLRQDYPQTVPQPPQEGYPWAAIDFKKTPRIFMKSLLNYIWEGNDSTKFRVEDNAKRDWYHTPWLDYGFAGREFIHGLTMGRISNPGELAISQKKKHRNYSITFYNAPGGYVLGKVWCDSLNPNPTKARFPVGTVQFTLNFTAADTSEVPQLAGALTWDAFVDIGTSKPFGTRNSYQLHLIQVDIAVKTAQEAATTGWVFGTYVYNGKKEGETLLDKMVLLGLQWGADPGVKPGGELKETWINPKAYNPKDKAASLVTHLGYGGRLAGPVDGSNYDLFTMHSRASWPSFHVVPQDSISDDSIMTWQVNMKGDTARKENTVPLDFSLELARSIYSMNLAQGRGDEGEPVFRGNTKKILDMEPEPEVQDEEEEDRDKGLMGRNLLWFLLFTVLILALIGFLIHNFRTEKEVDIPEES